MWLVDDIEMVYPPCYALTLEDLMKEKMGSVPADLEYGGVVTYCLKSFVDAVTGGTSPLTSVFTKTEANKLFCQYIWTKYRDSFCVSYKTDGSDKEAQIKKFIHKFIFIYNATFEYYKELIDSYASAKTAGLMSPIKTSTTDRFNDTPQNGGSFTSDSYTSTYTKSETEYDGMTQIDRLDEVQSKLRNLYMRWANGFDQLFWRYFHEEEIEV